MGVGAMLKFGETRRLLILSSRNSLILIVFLFIFDFSKSIILLLCYVGVF